VLCAILKDHHAEGHQYSKFEYDTDVVWCTDLFNHTNSEPNANNVSSDFCGKTEAAAVSLLMVINGSPNSLVEDELISNFLHI